MILKKLASHDVLSAIIPQWTLSPKSQGTLTILSMINGKFYVQIILLEQYHRLLWLLTVQCPLSYVMKCGFYYPLHYIHFMSTIELDVWQIYIFIVFTTAILFWQLIQQQSSRYSTIPFLYVYTDKQVLMEWNRQCYSANFKYNL